MLLEITHQTDLDYSEMISESVMELRVAPRQMMDQHRLSFDLSIGPPTAVSSYFDWNDNIVHAFTINGFHDRICMVAKSVVEVDRPALDLQTLPERWPLSRPDDHSYLDFLSFGGPVMHDARLQEIIANAGVREGQPVGRVLWNLVDAIHDTLTYEAGVTQVSSTIVEVLDQRRGVCQDYAQLYIGLARLLGIPARYVSGLVHPSSDKFRGAYQTHAWCEVFVPSAGWVGIDPTNRCLVGDHFVHIGLGRDYRDVPPNRGVYRGKADEKIKVTVTSRELQTVPSELSADRVHALSIPVFPGWGRDQRVAAGAKELAQVHQQQQ